MPLFQWTPAYSVKVEKFDEHHRQLFALINKLYDAMKEGKGKTVLDGVFKELIEYTVMHFGAEEEQMKTLRYPEMSAHLEEHRLLKEKVMEYQAKFLGGNMFVTVEVLEFLKNWLTNHIQKVDTKYSEFFNSKGLK
jgi:hemerythrin-like metal-binding protein